MCGARALRVVREAIGREKMRGRAKRISRDGAMIIYYPTI